MKLSLGLGLRIAASGLAILPALAVASCCRSNQCLRAIVAPALGEAGIAECSSNLAVTVIPAVRTVTATVTGTTNIAVTALFTNTLVATATTETVWFTETSTVTASTQTDAVTALVTVPQTATVLQTSTKIVSTKTVQLYDSFTIKKRATDLPEYVAGTCQGWAQYTAACKCIGVRETTVTGAAPEAETVTVPALADATEVATVSRTLVDVVSVSATTSGARTATVSVTATVTETRTSSVASLATVVSTVTAPAVATTTCQPRGSRFRVQATFEDGSVRYLSHFSGGTNALWLTSLVESGQSTQVWRLDDNGHLVGALGTAVIMPYLWTARDTTKSAPILMGTNLSQANFNNGVSARVAGCVDAASLEVYLSVEGMDTTLHCLLSMYMRDSALGADPSCPQVRLRAVLV